MKWQAGQSGNPGGRPRRERDIETLAQQHTALAIDTLARIAGGEKYPPAARVAAASALLARGWGNPVQTLEADGEAVRFVMLGVPEAESAEAWARDNAPTLPQAAT